MRIHCSQCERSFEADDAKAAGIDEVTCLCGATVLLREGGRGAERIGRYTLINQIAIGGMGEIWFARMNGSHGFEKEVAVKRLLPRYANDLEFTGMLIKEARISALMNHPNVAEVYDLAHVAGHYLIVMEYVAGVPVNDIINIALKMHLQLPWELGVVLVVQVLRGLHYAHRLPRKHGHETFIHRDISPQNLLITQQALVKIVDFGIARALNEASTTAPGMLRGKVCYQTPERMRGDAASEQTDLFPAAIVLYECWAMRHLFRGASNEESFRKVNQTLVPAMSESRNDISGPLEQVLRRALAHDPADRYPDAAAFETALLEACAPQTFEQLQGVASAFLNQRAALFFASIATHKEPPGLLPEDTRKILVRAGRAPSVSYILRTSPDPEAVDVAPTIPPTQATSNPTPKRYAWVGVAGALCFAGALGASLWQANGPTRQQGGGADVLSGFPQRQPVAAQPAAGPHQAPGPAGVVIPAVGPTASAVAQSGQPATERPSEAAQRAQLSPSPSAAQRLPRPSPTSAMLAIPSTPPDGLVPGGGPSLAPSPSPHAYGRAPSVAELTAFFRRRGAALVACFDEAHIAIEQDVAIQVNPDGGIEAKIKGDELSVYKKCFLTKLKRLRYPPFEGLSVQYVLPLRIAPRDG